MIICNTQLHILIYITLIFVILLHWLKVLVFLVKMTTILKKPKSNFLIFCDEKRPIIKAKTPDMKVTDVTRECSKQWEALTKEQKDVYTKKYEKEKELYAAYLLEQQSSSAAVTAPAIQEKVSKAKKASKKDDVGEKKSSAPVANGYIKFCSTVRARVKTENPELGPKDIMKKIGEMWKILSQEEKDGYKNKALVDIGKGTEPLAEKESVAHEEPKAPVIEVKQEKAAELRSKATTSGCASASKGEPVKKTRKPRKVSAEPELA